MLFQRFNSSDSPIAVITMLRNAFAFSVDTSVSHPEKQFPFALQK